MSVTKEHLASLKGKKVTFREVTSFPDIKVQFVENFPDFEVKTASSNAFSAEIIKIQVVTSLPDVKLKKVTSFGDFEAFYEK
ncbi:MAG: hypothetical protein IJ561_07205 [Ruminococcus sp.]|nr:hypothetical protein [Ruminococcus sp.]